MRFQTAIHIQAPQDRIWNILTDAAAYPSWNTTVDKVEGNIAPGERVTVHAKLSPGRAFPVTVSTMEAPRTMVWTGGMPLGLFKGERTFSLTPRDGGVEFSMTEVFSGLMAPLITKSIPNLQPAFDEFALCLKRKAEQAGHKPDPLDTRLI
jgi:hypothetical protein